MNKKIKLVGSVSVLVSLMPLMANGVAAQESRQQKAKADNRLEEVVVTARRKSESLQEVPTMVTAVSGEDLAKYGISSIEDLEMTTPGLIYADGVGYALPYIRGIGSNAFSPAVDPTVGTFLDGFYSPSTVGSLQYIGDVESVQVLKGPQGTLFGRNTTAGAIVINTKKPSEYLQGSIEYGIGTRNKEYVTGYLSGPIISDFLGFSVSAYSDEVESYYNSTYPNEDREYAPEEREGFRLKLRADFTDWLSLDLAYSESESRGSKGVAYGLEDAGLINATSAAAQKPDKPRSSSQDTTDGYTESDIETFTGKLSFNFDSVEAWILAGYMDVVGGTLGDLDITENSLLSYSYEKDDRGYFSDIDSVEFQISSVSDWSLFGVSYNWMFGAYTGEATAGWDPLAFNINADVLAGIVPGLPPVAGVRNEVSGIVDTDADALFANISIDLTSWMTLDLGVRQSDETRTIAKNKVDIYTTTNPNILDLSWLLDSAPITVRDISGPKLEFEDTSYLAGVNFFPSENSMVYVKFVQGFKSGTWNVTAVLNEPDAVDPEEVDSYEMGFKGEFFDNSLRLNAAAFMYDYTGLQNYQVEIASSGSVLVKSIDEAEVSGAEFDMTYLPPVAGLQFMLSGSYIDAKVEKWPDAPCFEPGTYLSLYSCDLAGNDLGGAPTYSGNFDVNYMFNLFGDEFQVGANYYLNGGFFFDVQNKVEQERYATVGVRASWYRDEWGTTFSISGKNITSEDYREFGLIFESGIVTRFAPAAEWTASIKWDM